MRRFTDENGLIWDVVIGRESWGTLQALFVPTGSSREPIRQAVLAASGYERAQQELEEMTEEALAALFRRSTPKES